VSLTAIFSGSLEVTVDFLTEIDRLVQLIESPIFTCKCWLLLTCYWALKHPPQGTDITDIVCDNNRCGEIVIQHC